MGRDTNFFGGAGQPGSSRAWTAVSAEAALSQLWLGVKDEGLRPLLRRSMCDSLLGP